MPFVRFHAVSYSHSSAVDLLTDVTFDLGPGWAGLVGANGSGKTTLLSLTAGEVAPQRGSVDVDGAVGWCHQDVDDPDTAVHCLAGSVDGADYRLRHALGLDPADLDRWNTLSPGERKRWQLGAVLAGAPDVLLLDEPTNHLDREATELLERALRSYTGVGIIVSHDRRFLDRLTTTTLKLDRGSLSVWRAPYSTARLEWEAVRQQEMAQYDRVKSERRKAERRLADHRRTAERERARTKRSFRVSGPKDHDAHSAAATGKAAKGDTAGARRIRTTRAAAARLDARAKELAPARERGGDIFFGFEPSRRHGPLSYRGPISVGSTPLIDDVDVSLSREDRVRLNGPNGSGKTTLLGRLLAHSGLDPGRMLYLPQETAPHDTRRSIERLMALTAGERGRVLQLVAALGSDPARILASDSLSAGEGRKLEMAFGMGTGAWCLVLDEPTNHLDLPSIERLEEALTAYPGALLIVTHDEHLADSVTDETWTIRNRELEIGGRPL